MRAPRAPDSTTLGGIALSVEASGEPALPYTFAGPLRTDRVILRLMTSADIDDDYFQLAVESDSVVVC